MLVGPGAFADPDPDFARELYLNGYPALAALEWARVAASGHPREHEAKVEMAYSLWRSEQVSDALRLLDVLREDSSVPVNHRAHALGLAATIELSRARFDSAAERALDLLESGHAVPEDLRDDFRKTAVVASLVAEDKEAALRRLDLSHPEEALIASELSEPVAFQKSPRLAGTLSALVPGAGQVYVGRRSDGVVAFLINGLLIGTAVEAFGNDRHWMGAATTVVASTWYLGNIHSAVNSAHKHNETRRANRTLSWLQRLDVGLSEESLRMGFRVTF